MRLETYVKEECLRQAVEITKAYVQSGENKHGPVTELLEQVYRMLLDLRAEAQEGQEAGDRGK